MLLWTAVRKDFAIEFIPKQTKAPKRAFIGVRACELHAIRIQKQVFARGDQADHIAVDFELRGCPIDKKELMEVITAFLHERTPRLPRYSVCIECKRRGNVCLLVAEGTPCLGPATQAGCGALCPAYHRGCFGCYGPMESPNTVSLSAIWKSLGQTEGSPARVSQL